MSMKSSQSPAFAGVGLADASVIKTPCEFGRNYHVRSVCAPFFRAGTPVARYLSGGTRIMGKNKKNDGVQQGATNHPPGLHGDKTVSRIAEISQTSNPERDRIGPRYDPDEIRSHNHPEGKSRLFEDREQHDEADKNSEKTRLARDIDRHDPGPDTELQHRNGQASTKRKT